MFIKSIELSNFRNYNFLSLDFHENVNLFYGDNAQGKTNILEALYLCGTTKSHKGSKDKELIKMHEKESHIRMFFQKQQIDHKVDMHLKRNKTKGIAVDGIPIRRSSELIGLANLIFFSPEDLAIIKNGPGERRRFIDMELCQLDKLYLHHLAKYNKILLQRNNLLKQIHIKKELVDTLDVWDIQLVEYGTKIIQRRREFIQQLNDIIYGIHHRLSGGKEELQIVYEPNITEEGFEKKLKHTRERDLILKMTTTGPHRDDIDFQIQKIDVRKFGSQGQQRTAALSLKLAEIEIVKNVIHDNPILLLDDVLSELDRNRQNYLLDNIQGIQTIITCTGLEEFIHHRLEIDAVYHVVNGEVSKI